MSTKRAMTYGMASAAQSGSVMAVAAIAGLGLKPDAFAEFAYFQAWVILSALVVDFGVAQAVLRQSAVERDVQLFLVGLRAKSAIGIIVLVIVAVAALVLKKEMLFVLGLAAILMSINATCRVYQSQVDDYKGLAVSSAVMLIASVGGVGVALWHGDWRLVAVGAFVVPSLVAVMTRPALIWPRLEGYEIGSRIRSILSYAPYLWLSGFLFSAAVPLVLVVSKGRLGSSSFGALGLAASFAGSLGMLITAFRVARYGNFTDLLVYKALPTRKTFLEFLLMNSAFAGLYVMASTVLVLLLRLIYEPRYPGVSTLCAILCVGFGLTGLVGFFNIRLQVRGYRKLEIAMNFFRLLVSVVLATVFARSAIDFAVILALTAIGFEVAYAGIGELVVHRSHTVGAKT